MLGLGQQLPLLIIQGCLFGDLFCLVNIEFLNEFLFFENFSFMLGYLVDHFVESLLDTEQFGPNLAGVDFGVQQLLVLLLDFLYVFLVLDLQLMEVDKLELIAHLLLLRDLVAGLDDLGRQGLLLAFVFLNEGFLLSVFLLKEFLDSLSFNIARPAILASHQNFSLEVVGIFADFGDCHVSFL